MQKIPWYQKIQIQIPMIVFLIILIPAAAFGSYDIGTSRQAQLKAAETQTAERLYETSLLMQDVMKELENTGKTLSGNREFLELLKKYLKSPWEPGLQSGLLLALGQSSWPNSYIEHMYLVSDNPPSVLSSDPDEKLPDPKGRGRFLYQAWLDGMQGQTTWSLLPSGENGETRLACWRAIPGGENTGGASLVCVLKNGYLENITAGLRGREGSLNVIGSYQGRLLYCDAPDDGSIMPDETLAENPLFREAYSKTENTGSYFAEADGRRWLVCYYNSLEDGWKYMCAVPEQLIYTGIADRKFIAILLISGLAGVLLGSLILYFLVVRPLGKLQKKMELMEKGQLEPLGFSGGKNEIGLVLHAYDHMIIRLKKLIDEVYVQQLLRKQAELSSLQSQMDEHFLYNTLNTIYCKADEEKANVSAAMILKLSQYFRLNLAGGQEKIPLNEILKLLHAYLQIQQMRYGQAMECRIETFPDMDSYISLKQLYQPIVENAIVHGFEKKPGNHRLRINFQKAGTRLRFTVQDDGIGMSDETCREVLSEMTAFDHVRGKGYALRNIREQIRITYGEDYGITMESRPGLGTTVILEVPLERRNKCSENIE
ncbi:cache domain-containing sensor histidine kinase [Clostridium transplantifaecale]|uniref:cache domain-containing sensor histidine kinase n=1 Tax=Clostridium transplantifaecale TaxID=2479838 RepID=UPI000F62FDE8|nr:sensor histidine kinase [Clostridium transplantifaecale]